VSVPPHRFSEQSDTMLTTVTQWRIDETIAFDGAQYAPARGEWKTLEAHREPAWLDIERH
jgi:hypothetical protein